MPDAPPPTSVSRLRFIDMARAVAILLMLEGHFVDVTLAAEWRMPGNIIYDHWLHVRGMAAPMFFTVTGVIFAYLLSGATEPGFLKVHRVRRGIVRAIELFFWGYFLQVDLRLLPRILHGEWDPWFQAFHVLQCIAVGLLVLIGLFGLLRKAGLWALAASYLITGFVMFLLGVILANTDGPMPHNMPAWLQNPFKGACSPFPLVPWLGFTLYGGVIGTWIRLCSKPQTGVSPLPFLAVGMALKAYGWALDRWLGKQLLDILNDHSPSRVMPDGFHGRIGEILLVMATLIAIERYLRPSKQWFEIIGRNTFPIYVCHAIVLYGAIFGMGLNDSLEKSLNPWQAVLGASVFCGFFALGAQYVEPLTLRWKTYRYQMRTQK